MDDPNPFREQFDLIVDSPILWSMHHTMLVWMRAGVPIAVVKPTYQTVFSAHATDMLTMLGMKNDLYFETDADLVNRIKNWIATPETFNDVKRRFEEGVSKIPSNKEAARNFHKQIMDIGLLSNEGLPEDTSVCSREHEDVPVPSEPIIEKQDAGGIMARPSIDWVPVLTDKGHNTDYTAEIFLVGCTFLFAIASSFRS